VATSSTQSASSTTNTPKQKPGLFKILVTTDDKQVLQQLLEDAGANGHRVYIELPKSEETVTGEQARSRASQEIYERADDDPYKVALLSEKGLDFRSASARTFKSDVISLEVPKPKLRRR
jgi:hypothetical protein